MKREYVKLCRKVEDATGDSHWLDADDDFEAFSNTKPNDHSTIVKVLLKLFLKTTVRVFVQFSKVMYILKLIIVTIAWNLVLCVYMKVVWENKGGVGDEKEVPHLVYISREKRPNYLHHYKTGAMNFLINKLSHTSFFFYLSKYSTYISCLFIEVK